MARKQLYKNPYKKELLLDGDLFNEAKALSNKTTDSDVIREVFEIGVATMRENEISPIPDGAVVTGAIRRSKGTRKCEECEIFEVKDGACVFAEKCEAGVGQFYTLKCEKSL